MDDASQTKVDDAEAGFYSSPAKHAKRDAPSDGVADWVAGSQKSSKQAADSAPLSTRSSTPLCVAAWALRSVCVLAVLFTWVLGFAAVYARSAARVRHTGLMRFGHLQHDVTVTFGGAGKAHDAHGTVHISARSMHDAAFALGLNHAQMRLWQLEFQRRVGQGRLSEIVGDGGLEMDQLMRALNVYEAAKESVATLSEEAVGVLQAYADGIN